MKRPFTRALLLLPLTVCVIASPALASPTDCPIPSDLRDSIAKKYADRRIETFGDLVEDDQKFYAADHHDRCPGIAHGDFFGDGSFAWILLLVSAAEGARDRVLFVVAHRGDSGWSFMNVGNTGGPAPAVWRDKPGEYTDIYGEKTITAKNPVFIICGYEAWSIVYSWNGNAFEKVWLSD